MSGRELSHIPIDLRKRLTFLTTQYLTGTDKQPEYKYLQASDVRRQVQQAPSYEQPVYPKKYWNKPPLPLQAQPPYKEFPIVPSPRNGSASRNYVHPDPPGPVRAFYNDGDRSKFDVGFHDEKEPPRGPREGRPYMDSPFSLAPYLPAPTYTDTSTIHRP